MGLKIIVTGGTFDKEYDEINGRLYFQDTHLPELLQMGRCKLGVKMETLMMIDSLDMTEEGRQSILNACKNCNEESIVITHGTDTMEITAQTLGNAKLDKTIVLTGAFIPIKFGSSDGLFNLGSAIAFAQTLPHGVYVAMQGKYFFWNNVRKNRSSGTFEETLKN